MRTFVALPISDGIRTIIDETISGFSNTFPPSRWVPMENLHLTLRFLGEVNEARIDRLELALRDAFSDHEPVMVQLGEAGTFPKKRPARVAWLGLTDSFSLKPLALSVLSATDPFVDDRTSRSEGLDFFPHITVARSRKPWPRAIVRNWQKAFPVPLGPSFMIGGGVLMRSRLGSGGARYDVLCELPLRSN